jgi:hypothetical protein
MMTTIGTIPSQSLARILPLGLGMGSHAFNRGS